MDWQGDFVAFVLVSLLVLVLFFPYSLEKREFFEPSLAEEISSVVFFIFFYLEKTSIVLIQWLAALSSNTHHSDERIG